MAFTWHTVGHAFSSILRDIVSTSKKVEIVLTDIEANAQVIEQLTGLVCPQAAAIEMLAFGCLGEVLAIVHQSEAAATSGVTVSFDATVVQELKQLMVDVPQLAIQVDRLFKHK